MAITKVDWDKVPKADRERIDRNLTKIYETCMDDKQMKTGDRVELIREGLIVTITSIHRNRVNVELDDEPYLNVDIAELKPLESDDAG
jgi:preprotein translocase subunit YajC